MKKLWYTVLCFVLFCFEKSFSQSTFIYTKDGRAILKRKPLIEDCLRGLHKDKSDITALSICECQINKLDGHFTNRQYRQYTNDHVIDLSGLFKEDSIFEKEVQQCYTNSGKTILLQAEGFEGEFISDCIKGIEKNTEKTLDKNRLTAFCSCQLNLVKTKRLTDTDMATLSDPNSLLFYEIMYKCGDPFSVNDNKDKNWTATKDADITGPVSDTLTILSLDGMTYLKIKIGSLTKIWLLDTGASDLLINKEMETLLKKEMLITDADYRGIGEYEMANGMIDTCRKYVINNISIGKFILNNITVAVTDKGKRIIAGKSLLNKFSSWILNNENNTIVLTR